MSQSNVIKLLNHLLADQRFSRVNYLKDARPSAHHGNEALLEATHHPERT